MVGKNHLLKIALSGHFHNAFFLVQKRGFTQQVEMSGCDNHNILIDSPPSKREQFDREIGALVLHFFLPDDRRALPQFSTGFCANSHLLCGRRLLLADDPGADGFGKAGQHHQASRLRKFSLRHHAAHDCADGLSDRCAEKDFGLDRRMLRVR
jgi:hypothetical protein